MTFLVIKLNFWFSHTKPLPLKRRSCVFDMVLRLTIDGQFLYIQLYWNRYD